MRVTTKDIRTIDSTIKSYYIRNSVMATEDWKLDNGALYKVYETEAIKLAMETKRWVAMTCGRLSTSDRQLSLSNIDKLLEAIAKLEAT